VRRTSRFTLQMGAAAAALALIAGACGSSHSSSTGGGSGGGGSSGASSQIYADNSGGTAATGGTLTMLGVGDVDYMDPNVSYYSIGYLNLRMWSRNLYAYPAVQGQTFTPAPDLATAMPTITDGGLKYAVTIRTGVMWDTNPARQVTAADVVRGVERSCNPTQPFGGEPDYSDILAGYTAFCNGFANVSATSASAQETYINDSAKLLTGVTVDPSNPLTVDFTLTKPATYFTDILSLPPFSPAPVEILQYLPASNALAQNTISDGPYKVQSYNPTKSIVYVRNPVWNASTDPLRKAYVNQIDVSETGQQQEIWQEIETNTPSADMQWDTAVPTPAVPGLISSKSPGFYLLTTDASNPYVIFNAVSPNNNAALGKVQVRQALSYALDQTALLQDNGGPNVAPALTHILPPGINGSTPNFDDYSYNPTKAKQMLQAAGASSLSLKFLYRPASAVSTSMFQTIQAELGAIGVKVTGVGVPNADFYTKYLEVPSVGKQGGWDLSLAGWSPDWYGDAAKSFFLPLFTGTPPSSSNFGQFNDPNLTPILNNALAATTTASAGNYWHQADVEVMNQAAIYPITSPNWPGIHGTQVHNCIFVAQLQNCDPTNIWVTS
jgi:peptide/nickel transport system substrate-binding protein